MVKVLSPLSAYPERRESVSANEVIDRINVDIQSPGNMDGSE